MLKSILLKLALLVFPDREFVSVLKWELKLFLIHVYSRVSPLEWIKIRCLRKAKDLKVNLGSGRLIREGWVNIDCHISWTLLGKVACDIRRGWPIPSRSVRYIFAEHVLEHVNYPQGVKRVLRECYRTLKDGGVLRVIVPDAERYMRAYIEDNKCFFDQVAPWVFPKMAVVNKVFRENGFHKYAYDYETLKEFLENTGFKKVYRSSFRSSCREELNLDLDEPGRKLQSLYIEAIR